MSWKYNYNKTTLNYKSIIRKFNKEKKKYDKLNIKNKNITVNKNDIDDLTNKFNNINLNKKKNYKNKIIKLFNKNIRGKIINKNNLSHDGEIGHKLEKLMNIKLNANCKPDIYGYEMKKHCNKITFGDWSATEYIFSNNKKIIDSLNSKSIKIKKTKSFSKNNFLKIFGTPKKEKNNRYSWSGKCVPKYDVWNDSGQKIIIDNKKNISAIYSYKKDKRKDKNTFPKFIRKSKEPITIAYWSKEKMEKHVNDKFNQKGFFICKTNDQKEYNKICFGGPISFEFFIKNIKNKIIILDSGMKEGNYRNYSHWRANSSFWDNLITEEY
jgi:hypothetical protein